MKIAITGGSGGVGRAIVAMALGQGHSVVSIDRVVPAEGSLDPSVLFVEADMGDYDALQQAFSGCDAVIHMAAIPSPGRHPDQVVHNNNVVGSYNALRAAAELGITHVCQASSVNAIGASYSRWPRYDYFPLDEQHPTYNEDPYSLSKWICEQQADSFARRYEQMTIASMRFHWVVPNREFASRHGQELRRESAKHLWGYTTFDAAARACLAAVSASWKGHEVFYIVGPATVVDVPSAELAQRFFPDVPVRGDLSGHRGFYSCAKAERLLGWKHDPD
jgi:UDP-glucose 4-epimerase